MFSVDIYDLGGIENARVAEEALWIVQQFVRDIQDVADVDRPSIEQQVSGEFIDEELDRYRNLRFSFLMTSAKERLALQQLLFRRLRDIDTGCMASAELENYFGN